MGRPARSLADDGFVAFSQDETRPASFVPLSVEQAPQAWEPLAGGAELGRSVARRLAKWAAIFLLKGNSAR